MNNNNEYQQDNMEEYQEAHLSFWDWVKIDLLLLIPFVNLIIAMCWAVGSKNPSKRNRFRADFAVFGTLFLIEILVLLYLYPSYSNLITQP